MPAHGLDAWALHWVSFLAGTVAEIPYIEQLASLQKAGSRYPTDRDKSRKQAVRAISTPLQVEEWARILAEHPNTQFAALVTDGLRRGFRIGFDRGHRLRSACSNLKGARDHPEVVDAYIAAECRAGTVLGPFDPALLPAVHISKFGVIPKPHRPGEWRLIVDLSALFGESVNDGISAELSSVKYTRLQEVVQHVASMGTGAMLAKFDIKSAYRLVPVHPADRDLLGMQWKGKLYVDAALPFGLRSAPFLFTAVADVLQWIFQQHGVLDVWHYLDDFITVGSAGQINTCQNNLDTMIQLCHRLGVPLAPGKLVGACTKITFLGLEIDTVAGVLRLPEDKLGKFKSTVAQWKSCTKKQLQSLIGQLNHATAAVRPGRTFLRRLIDLCKTACKRCHYVSINSDARSDILWWDTYLADWNGTALLSVSGWRAPDMSFGSDASGSWGCGAHWDTHWFQLAWSSVPKMRGKNIATQELLPILVAAAVWGSQWRGRCVQCWCHNEAVVAVITSRGSRDKELMHLLHCLFFLEASFQFSLVASHIPGANNTRADDLSRDNLPAFLQGAEPDVDSQPLPFRGSFWTSWWCASQIGHQNAGGRCSAIL